jgi:hypothetical protein
VFILFFFDDTVCVHPSFRDYEVLNHGLVQTLEENGSESEESLRD